MHLWQTKRVMKHKIFAWLFMMDRLNTRNMLKRRHYVIASGWSCLLCPAPPEEDLGHLFFSCPFSQQCWNVLGNQWQLNQPLSERLLSAKLA